MPSVYTVMALGLASCTAAVSGQQMNALWLTKFVGTSFGDLKVGQRNIPTAKSGQVLIRVNTTSINPCDVDLVESAAEAAAAIVTKKTLGFDCSGTVTQCDGCSRLKVGDEVWTDLGEFGLDIVEMGGFAEYAVADEKQVGLKPTNLEHSHAGVVPLVALTNYQALKAAHAPWDPAANKTVVVTSGSGGTGHLAVQQAKAWGAGFLVTAAGPASLAFVKGLGADLVVDYTKGEIWDALEDDSVDVVYDNYGAAGSADKAMRKLRKGGVLVLIQGKETLHPKNGVEQTKVLCKAGSHEQLDDLKAQVEAGLLKPHVQQTIALSNISAAYTVSHGGQVVGKLGVSAYN